MIRGAPWAVRAAARALLTASVWLGAQASAQAAPPSSGVTSDAASRAVAAPTRPLVEAIEVDPGATCLNAGTLLENLRSWRESGLLDARVAVDVTGSPDDPRALTFEVHFGPELAVHRDFERAPKRCADLHAVVALAIAIALDDTLAGDLGIVEPAPAATDPLPTQQVHAGEGDLPLSLRQSRPPTATRRPVFGVTLAAGAFAGFSPRLGAGGLLFLDVRPRPHFDLRVAALYTRQSGFPLLGGSIVSGVSAGRLDLCWGTAPLAVRLRACGGVIGGATVASGRSYIENFNVTLPYFAGLAGIDLTAHIAGPLALEARVDAVVPFQTTRLEIRYEDSQNRDGETFSPVSLIVALGLRMEFGGP